MSTGMSIGISINIISNLKNSSKTPISASRRQTSGMFALMVLVILIPLTTITGCQKPQTTLEEGQNVKILSDKVIIDRSMVLTSNPERYQPSYNLEGLLIPIAQETVASPHNAHHPELLVQIGDWVTQNQPLLRLHSDINRTEIDQAHYDFVDITTDTDFEANNQNEEPSSHSILSGKLENRLSNVTHAFSDAEETAATQSIDSEKVKDNTTSENDSIDSISNKQSQDKKSDDNKPVTNRTPTRKKVGDAADDDAPKSTEQAISHSATDKPNISTAKGDSDKVATTLTLKSPIEGEITKIEHINIETQTQTSDHSDSAQQIPSNTALITVADTRTLQLVGKLPLSTQSQLSVGSPVNFTIHDNADAEFAGQISHVIPKPDKGYLLVRAPVLPSSENKVLLEPGMHALMTIEYGQIELAVRLPRSAIHEAVLSELNENHTRPVSPIHGYVWVIEQNQRLTYTPVEVVQYFPKSDQFLVHGLNNDSLICLADLPKDSADKIVAVD